MTTAEDIRAWIAAGLPGAQITVLGDDGAHFEAQVICAEFAGLSTLKRHQMVYAALGPRMGREIHALTLRTQTAEEAGA